VRRKNKMEEVKRVIEEMEMMSDMDFEWDEILDGMEWDTEEEKLSLMDSYREGVEEIKRDEEWTDKWK
jgi:DNA polymerase III sliding clamp (beta) subunit (PCNA family)